MLTRIVLSLVAFALVLQPAKAADPLGADAQEFIKSHCIKCHDARKQKGKFRLDNLSADFTDPQVAEKWNEVVFRINAAEMPPEDEPQPSAEEIGRMVGYLTGKIREGAASRMARRGLLEHYRLSREDYAHTVYALLGVVYDVEAPGAFNEDPRWHGFDRIGAMLATAPSHIDRYFKAADTVIELASLGGEPPSRVQRKAVGEGKRYLAQPGEGWNCFNVRKPGRYRVRMRLSSLPAFTGRAPRLALWHHNHKKPVWGRYLVADENKPETLEFEMLFNQGGYKLLNYARTQKHPNSR